ncbi:MAG TPA: ester cyclase [Actinomycetota bacterium]|nr:ester cyclase [Actinomycetota bacterium]
MDREEMKRLYLEHREVEEARDLDAVVATFDDDCFLENVGLGTKAEGRAAVRRSYEALFAAFPDLSPDSEGEAYGDDLFVTWGTVHGTMTGSWLGIPPTGKSFRCTFVNIVPFRNGKMQGERLFFDLPALCAGAGISVEDVLAGAAAAGEG